MDNYYYSKFDAIESCRNKIVALLKDKEEEWAQTSKTYIESGDLQGALMTKEWSFACSLLSIPVVTAFSSIVSEMVTEMNSINKPTEDEKGSDEWNCHQQMNG